MIDIHVHVGRWDKPRQNFDEHKYLFHYCGQAGMPVLFRLADRVGGVYGLADDLGLPRLERILCEFPATNFIE